MSIKAMTWAFGLPLEPRAKIALLAIADNARDDGIAWPSRDLIAEKSSQSRATINRRLKILAGLGVLGIHERYREDGSQTTDEIRLDLSLTPDDVQRRIDTLKPDEREDSGRENDDEGGVPSDTPPVQSSHPGESEQQSRGYHCGNPQDEPSLEPIPPPSPPPGAGGPLSKSDKQANEKREGLWKKFLGVYPGIVAMDQDITKHEFLKLSVEHCEWAVAAASGYDAECRKLKKPPKNAHIWLRKGMFRNLPPTGVAVTAGPGHYPRASKEASALKTLFDLAGALDFFVKFVRKGEVIYYAHAVPAQLAALAEVPPREEWVKATREQAASWNQYLDKYPTIERRKRFVEGDFVPANGNGWRPNVDGSWSTADREPATGPPEQPDTLMSEQDMADFQS